MAVDTSVSLLLLLAAAVPILAMDCSFGTEENAISKIAHSCPRPLIDSSDKKFCCFDTNGDFYCCEGGTFALYVLVGLIILLIPISVLCCICCCVWRCLRS